MMDFDIFNDKILYQCIITAKNNRKITRYVHEMFFDVVVDYKNCYTTLTIWYKMLNLQDKLKCFMKNCKYEIYIKNNLYVKFNGYVVNREFNMENSLVVDEINIDERVNYG